MPPSLDERKIRLRFQEMVECEVWLSSVEEAAVSLDESEDYLRRVLDGQDTLVINDDALHEIGRRATPTGHYVTTASISYL